MKIGTNDITDIKIGGTSVNQVRIGTTLVWEKSSLLLMQQPTTIEQEEPTITTVDTTLTQTAEQGFFSGMWTFIKNLFNV